MDPIAYIADVPSTENSLINVSKCINKNIDISGCIQDDEHNKSRTVNEETCMTIMSSSISCNKPENSFQLVSPNENSEFGNKCVAPSHQFISETANTLVSSPFENLENRPSHDNCDVTILKIIPKSHNYDGKSKEIVSSPVITREESSVSQLRIPTSESDENIISSFAEQLNPLTEQINCDVCHECHKAVTKVENSLTWGSMIFCNDKCLGSFQKLIGAFCAKCNAVVERKCLGKYSVHFVFGIKQFCSKLCLEHYKKCLRKCIYCREDVSIKQSIVVPDGEYVRVFCSMKCINKWERQNNCKQCAVCNKNELVLFEVILKSKEYKLCSDHCFAAFKFVNNIDAAECKFCKKYFDKSNIVTLKIFGQKHNFCSENCQNLYVSRFKDIVSCDYCKVKKYKYDMVKSMTKDKTILIVCSLTCLDSYRSSLVVKCFNCNGFIETHFSMQNENRDVILCSYNCFSEFKTKILGKTGENNHSPSSEKEETPNKAENEKICCVNFGEQGRENVSVQVFPVMSSKEISVFPEMNSMGIQTDFT